MEIKYKNRTAYNSGKAIVLSVPKSVTDAFEETTNKDFRELVFTLRVDGDELIYKLEPDVIYVPPTSQRYDDTFKQKVVKEARENSNLSEVARKFGVSPTSVTNWMKEVDANDGIKA